VIADDEFEELPAREPAWAVLDRITAYRKALLAAGYWPVPVNGKKVLLDDWVNARATPAIIDTWAVTRADHLSTGILTGDTPFVDIDVTVEEVAEEIEALFEVELESSAVRIGLPPKRAIPIRTEAPFKKISTSFLSPNGKIQKVEILGAGQQIVVNGIHPDTQQPYRWHGSQPGPKLRREDLPLITAEYAAGYIAAAAAIMRTHGWTEVESKKANGTGKTSGAAGADHGGGASERERAYARATLDGCADELAAATPGTRNDMLYKKSFRIGTMVARGWIARTEVEAALFDAAEACGLVADDGEVQTRRTIQSGLDDGAAVPHPDLQEQAKSADENWEDAAQPSSLLIKSSKEFVAGFVPPEYVVVGLLQRRFFYSLTGQTGAGKTAIMLLLSASAALGRPFAGKETKPIRVLYLAAENADDVRMRWIAFAQNMDFEIDTIEVYFVEGRFSLSKSLQLLRSEAERRGGEFGMIVVDTGPTFFEGKDENENKQLGDHARMLRSLIDTIPGGPCLIANCHPTKNAQPDQLIPRGGGAFLAETDGNLTAAKTESTVELHWQGKFRGPDFAPMYFLIRTVTHEDLKDSDGRLIPTVIAEHISDQAQEDIAAAAQKDEDAVLAFIGTNPAASQAAIATAVGWQLYNGEPNKMKAGRCIKALVKAKLIKVTRAGRYKLTPEGEAALKGEADD
jgi:hypothetical protein